MAPETGVSSVAAKPPLVNKPVHFLTAEASPPPLNLALLLCGDFTLPTRNAPATTASAGLRFTSGPNYRHIWYSTRVLARLFSGSLRPVGGGGLERLSSDHRTLLRV